MLLKNHLLWQPWLYCLLAFASWRGEAWVLGPGHHPLSFISLGILLLALTCKRNQRRASDLRHCLKEIIRKGAKKAQRG